MENVTDRASHTSWVSTVPAGQPSWAVVAVRARCRIWPVCGSTITLSVSPGVPLKMIATPLWSRASVAGSLHVDMGDGGERLVCRGHHGRVGGALEAPDRRFGPSAMAGQLTKIGNRGIQRHRFDRSRHSQLEMDDADAFIAVYEREREAVIVFVARRTLDVAVAADLTAETFALALRSWARLRGRSEAEMRGWLFTVARRQVSQYLRRCAVERRAVERLGIRVPVMHEDDVTAIEALAGLAELREALGVELRRLSREQRDALQLRVVEDRPYDDVARTLGISEQAARARVSRGLRALAQALEPYHEAREASR